MQMPEQEGRCYAKVTLNNCPSRISNVIDYPPTGLEPTNNKEETILYPNPSDGRFTVSFGTDPVRQATIKVFSLQGNLNYSEIFQDTTKAEIDLKAFPKGMYVIKVITNDSNYNGKVQVLKCLIGFSTCPN